VAETAECPFCKHENRIEEPCEGDDETREVNCDECGRDFVAVSHISVSYSSSCKDGEHIEHPGPHRIPPTEGYAWCLNCGDLVRLKDLAPTPPPGDPDDV
jgi:hypothetical protein